MSKIIFSVVFSVIFCAAISAVAQSVDSVKKDTTISATLQSVDSVKKDTIKKDTIKKEVLKKDTVKIDTMLLNKYRIDPRRNALPVRTRAVQIQPELIPLTMLDYKVNYWHKWITFAFNLSQSAFSSNYSAGGVSAAALGTNFDYKTEYNKAPFDYTAELNLIYGISKNKGQGSRKTNDRIFFDNKVATQLSKHWFFFGDLSFESQFDKGFQYADGTANPPLRISNFMAPGYLTESVGFEYKPTKYFDLRIGTGAARQTFVVDTTVIYNGAGHVAYNISRGHTFRNDLAFQLVAGLDKDIAKNIHLNTRYALFVPYGQSPAFISHRVDAIFTAKVNRLVSVTVNGTFLYDKHTAPKPQGTEGLALGIAYVFP